MPAVTSAVSSPLSAVKKVKVFKNGDPYHNGIEILINLKYTPTLDVLLTGISERIDLPFGAKKLFTTTGSRIRDIAQLRDGHSYVASSNIFVPLAYGEKKVSSTNEERRARPSRSQEPKKKHKKKVKRVAASVEPPHKETSDTTEHPKPKKHKQKEPKEDKEAEVHKKKIVKKHKKVKEEPGQKSHHKEPEVHDHEEVAVTRPVSRMTNRPSTRGSLLNDAEVDLPDDLPTGHEHRSHGEHGSHEVRERGHHGPIDDESDDSKENLEAHEHEENHDHHISLGNDQDDVKSEHETPRTVRMDDSHHHEEVGIESQEKKEHLEGTSRRRPSKGTNWGDLSSFTKNIESLLKRK